MYHLIHCIFDAIRGALALRWLRLATHRVARAWRAHRLRAAARRDLRSIDERTLRDIGLSHRAAADWPRVRDLG